LDFFFFFFEKLTTTILNSSDFIITASIDGHLKFWKKTKTSVEFVKHYRCHLGNFYFVDCNYNYDLNFHYLESIQCIDASNDGTLLATVGKDNACKVFDIVNFGIFFLFE